MATDDAYLRTCRALNWRTAQLRANGIEPLKLTDEHPHEPPVGFDFDVEEAGSAMRGSLDSNLARALWLAEGKREDLWDTPPGGLWANYMTEQRAQYMAVARRMLTILQENASGR